MIQAPTPSPPIVQVPDWAGLVAAIIAFFAAATPVVTGIGIWLASKRGIISDKKVDMVAAKLDTTNTTQEIKLDALKEVADKTHILSNSRYGDSLRLTATTARSLANFTKSPTDTLAAEQAEEMLREHMGKQATVDAKEAEGKS